MQDAVVEEKQKRDDDSKKKDEDLPGSSKRQTRASGKKEEIAKPMPEIVMEEVSKKEKGKKKSPSFKLKTNIELMTDIHQVFEERILNSKVEMRLQELLTIVKPKFHAMFNDLTKRRRHVVDEQANPKGTRKALNVLSAEEDLQDSNEEEEEILADSNAKQVHFHDRDEEHIPRSHFTKTHWARATTETMVKVDYLDQPVVALVDSRSKINIMSKSIFKKGNWPIDMDHG